MDKYGRELDLILLLADNGSYTAQEIADRLLKQKRGVTLLKGEGAYSGEERQVVCIAVHKNEYVKVKRIVKQTDPNAFVIITGASEVLGKGFQKLD